MEQNEKLKVSYSDLKPDTDVQEEMMAKRIKPSVTALVYV